VNTSKRVLLPGAGTGAGNNLIRSLRADYPGLVIVGAHVDRFTLRNSKANRNYLLPPRNHPRFVEGLRHIMEREAIDLLFPNSDADVALASEHRDVLPCRVFLPSKAVIDRCQDKYELGEYLRGQDVPVAVTYPVSDLGALDDIFDRLGQRGRAWCRIRSGYGSRGAAPVDTPEDARAWIGYWQRMRGVPAARFTLSEYLPGRDFACQSLWKDGRLVMVKTVERLAYLDAESRASGTSSIASLAKTVNEPVVVETCTRAIRALDPYAGGAFSIDLKANRSGVPCITEINAGRFITMMNFFDFTGGHNMSAAYIRLAFDEIVDITVPYDVAEASYLVRGVDMVPTIFSADDLFEGIEDAR
jgi:carbamoylphosphate synthase large subunit